MFFRVIDRLIVFILKVTKQYLRHMWMEITNHKLWGAKTHYQFDRYQ